MATRVAFLRCWWSYYKIRAKRGGKGGKLARFHEIWIDFFRRPTHSAEAHFSVVMYQYQRGGA